MPDFDNWYYADLKGNKLGVMSIGTATFVETENTDYDEDLNVFATIPYNDSVTMEFKQTKKQARKTAKLFRSITNNYKRRIRSWFRTKERLRRAKLKGKEGVRLSPKIVKYLIMNEGNQNEN